MSPQTETPAVPPEKDAGVKCAINNEPNNGDDDDADHENTSCGIGSWRPAWLQFFASPMFFLINLGLVGVIQGMTGTIFFSSMSTFEKRFAFDSRLSSIIMIADN